MPELLLKQHQVDFLFKSFKNPRYGHWLDCGLGKTASILSLVKISKTARDLRSKHLLKNGFDLPVTTEIPTKTEHGEQLIPACEYYKTLVVCPKGIMRAAWLDDRDKYFPDIDMVVCWDAKPRNRVKLINTKDADVLVVNFEMFKRHFSDFMDSSVQRLVVDESSIIKSVKSNITKDVIEFADEMESVYLLSGTPAPNGEHEYFTQIRAIDPDVFGRYPSKFLYYYFTPIMKTIHVKQMINGNLEVVKKKVTAAYDPIASRRNEFIRKLRSVSWSLKKEDALDLPGQFDIERRFDLTAKETEVYNIAKHELYIALRDGDYEFSKQAKTAKLRQLTSGWAYDESGVAMESGDSKLEALDQLLNEIGPEPVCIVAWFTNEVEEISRLLKSRKETYDCIYGKSKRKPEEVKGDFQSGKLQRLIFNPRSAAHGFTFTASRYLIYYTMPWSNELYKQSRDRIHRMGQTRDVTYYHLIARDTIDEVVYVAVKENKSAAEAVLKMLSDQENINAIRTDDTSKNVRNAV